MNSISLIISAPVKLIKLRILGKKEMEWCIDVYDTNIKRFENMLDLSDEAGKSYNHFKPEIRDMIVFANVCIERMQRVITMIDEQDYNYIHSAYNISFQLCSKLEKQAVELENQIRETKLNDPNDA